VERGVERGYKKISSDGQKNGQTGSGGIKTSLRRVFYPVSQLVQMNFIFSDNVRILC
jgi:hypothetical protein